MQFQTRNIRLTANIPTVFSATCNCLLIEAATGTITLNAENGNFEAVVGRVYRADAMGKIQSITSTVSEEIRVTTGAGLILNQLTAADLQTIVASASLTADLWGDAEAVSGGGVLAAGLNNNVTGGAGRPKAIVFSVAADSQEPLYIGDDGTHANTDKNGVCVLPGESVRLYSCQQVALPNRIQHIMNPGLGTCTYSYRWEF